MNKIKQLNPIWFYNKSWDYMQGYKKWDILKRMPMAYLRYCYYTLFD